MTSQRWREWERKNTRRTRTQPSLSLRVFSMFKIHRVSKQKLVWKMARFALGSNFVWKTTKRTSSTPGTWFHQPSWPIGLEPSSNWECPSHCKFLRCLQAHLKRNLAHWWFRIGRRLHRIFRRNVGRRFQRLESFASRSLYSASCRESELGRRKRNRAVSLKRGFEEELDLLDDSFRFRTFIADFWPDAVWRSIRVSLVMPVSIQWISWRSKRRRWVIKSAADELDGIVHFSGALFRCFWLKRCATWRNDVVEFVCLGPDCSTSKNRLWTRVVLLQRIVEILSFCNTETVEKVWKEMKK